MESETNAHDAQEQLVALAQAQRAATVAAHPPSAWWVPAVSAMIGPIAVSVEVLSGALRLGIVGLLLGGLLWLAVRESRSAKVRLSRLANSEGFGARFGFIFVLIMSLQAIRPLSDRVAPWLLAGVSYLVYLVFFRVWIVYTERLVEQRVGPEIGGQR